MMCGSCASARSDPPVGRHTTVIRGEPLHSIRDRGECGQGDLADAIGVDVLQVALQDYATARDLVRVQGSQRGLESVGLWTTDWPFPSAACVDLMRTASPRRSWVPASAASERRK